MVVRGPLCGTAIDGSCCVVVGNSTKVINFLQKKRLLKLVFPLVMFFQMLWNESIKCLTHHRDVISVILNMIIMISLRYPHNIPQYPHNIPISPRYIPKYDYGNFFYCTRYIPTI